MSSAKEIEPIEFDTDLYRMVVLAARRSLVTNSVVNSSERALVGADNEIARLRTYIDNLAEGI